MKTAFFALGLSFIVPSVDAIDYEVASCAELAEVDYTSATSLTITSTPFECDSYTRFRVRNDMVLKSDSAVEFSNFALKVLGTLIVEPDVTFRDVVEQDTNGGALYVDRGSSATFMGAARFIGNSVVAEEFQGGAVFNKGDLVFEGATEFSNNEVRTSDNTDKGRGGAIYNARVGTITFNGPLTASANNADGFFEGEGGCIFNAGEIVVEDTSSFTENTTGAGGAVFIRPTGTMTFNGFATFTENLAFDNRGGGIASAGSLNLMGGSLFLSNVADDSSGEGGSGGGIFNGEEGSLSFGGDNTFNGNRAYFGGAIYNDGGSSLSPPQDGGELIFINGSAEMCPDIYTNGADPECSS